MDSKIQQWGRIWGLDTGPPELQGLPRFLDGPDDHPNPRPLITSGLCEGRYQHEWTLWPAYSGDASLEQQQEWWSEDEPTHQCRNCQGWGTPLSDGEALARLEMAPAPSRPSTDLKRKAEVGWNRAKSAIGWGKT